MNDVFVLENSFCNGIRRKKLLTSGTVPLSQLIWEHVPAEVATDGVAVHVVDEEGLGLETITLSWMAREVVITKENIGQVWWHLSGMNLRLGSACAAGVYFQTFESLPSVVYLRKVPGKVPEKLEIEVDDQVAGIAIKTADWVPNGFLVVMEA